MGDMADLQTDQMAEETEHCKIHDTWYHPEEDCTECIALNWPRPVMRKHWYFITYTSCPACGKYTVSKERRYTKRPKKYWDRHEEMEIWDGCGAL